MQVVGDLVLFMEESFPEDLRTCISKAMENNGKMLIYRILSQTRNSVQ